MRRGKGSTKYARRERDYDRMAWVRSLPCAVLGYQSPDSLPSSLGSLMLPPWWHGPQVDPCRRWTEAHHAGEHGYGNKAPDATVIPMCDHHHDSLGERRGIFAGWPHGAVKQWELAMIAYYQRRYAERGESPF